jgi:hypothetical protein
MSERVVEFDASYDWRETLTPEAPLFVSFAGVTIANLICFVMSCPVVPMVDLPKWMYQGRLLSLAIHGDLPPGYHLIPAVVPNSASILLIGLLSSVFDIDTAARITIVIAAALFLYGSIYLVGALGAPMGHLAFYLPLILISAHFFSSGELSYLIGLGYSFLFLGYVIRRSKRPESLGYSVPILLQLATCASSLMAFVPALLMAPVITVSARNRRMWRVLVASSVAPIALTVWYAYARRELGTLSSNLFNSWTPGMLVGVCIDVFSPFQTFAPWTERTLLSSRMLAILNMIFCTAVVTTLPYSIYAWWRKRRDGFVLVAAFVAIAAVLPAREFSGASTGERFLFPAFFTACAWLGAHGNLKRRFHECVVAVECALILTQVIYLWGTVIPVANRLQQSLAHLESVTSPSQFARDCNSLSTESWPTAHGDPLGHFLPNNPIGTLVIYRSCISQKASAPIRPDGMFYRDPPGDFYDQCSWIQCIPNLRNSTADTRRS